MNVMLPVVLLASNIEIGVVGVGGKGGGYIFYLRPCPVRHHAARHYADMKVV